MPSYPPTALANFFLAADSEEQYGVTQMKLQKLVYLAYGWHLAQSDGRDRISNEPPQAWQFGPVFPSLYRSSAKYGAAQIHEPLVVLRGEELFTPYVPYSDQWTLRTLSKVWKKYRSVSAIRLMALTHQKDTPWYITWHEYGGKHQSGAIIDDTLILQHWREILHRREGAEA